MRLDKFAGVITDEHCAWFYLVHILGEGIDATTFRLSKRWNNVWHRVHWACIDEAVYDRGCTNDGSMMIIAYELIMSK